MIAPRKLSFKTTKASHIYEKEMYPELRKITNVVRNIMLTERRFIAHIFINNNYKAKDLTELFNCTVQRIESICKIVTQEINDKSFNKTELYDPIKQVWSNLTIEDLKNFPLLSAANINKFNPFIHVSDKIKHLIPLKQADFPFITFVHKWITYGYTNEDLAKITETSIKQMDRLIITAKYFNK